MRNFSSLSLIRVGKKNKTSDHLLWFFVLCLHWRIPLPGTYFKAQLKENKLDKLHSYLRYCSYKTGHLASLFLCICNRRKKKKIKRDYEEDVF